MIVLYKKRILYLSSLVTICFVVLILVNVFVSYKKASPILTLETHALVNSSLYIPFKKVFEPILWNHFGGKRKVLEFQHNTGQAFLLLINYFQIAEEDGKIIDINLINQQGLISFTEELVCVNYSFHMQNTYPYYSLGGYRVDISGPIFDRFTKDVVC